MNPEEFSNQLMNKLAGDLSENDTQKLQAFVAEENLQEEYDFYNEVWQDMGKLEVASPSENLSANFYARLAAYEERKENNLLNRLKTSWATLNAVSPVVKNLVFGAFLLVFGFLLGGKLQQPTLDIHEPTTTAIQQSEETVRNYVPSTKRLQTLKAEYALNDPNSIEHFKNIVVNERNTNVRLAALTHLSNSSISNKEAKRFYLEQLAREQSPLVQVELLNLIIENSKTKESIYTMESLLTQQRLNPIVQEKIKKDLPVLRASFVE